MIRKYGLYFSWVLSCLGVIGSLYFSEALLIEPCRLCWYQRMALFPLAIILGMMTYTQDRKSIRYALPFALLGLLFATYQVLIQQIPGWNPIELCGSGPDCTKKIEIGLGFLTIPLLSAINFLLISFFLLATWFGQTQERIKSGNLAD